MLGLALAAQTMAHPMEESRTTQFQTVRLTLRGGPASYDIEFPADGKTYMTSEISDRTPTIPLRPSRVSNITNTHVSPDNSISVNIVESPAYDAMALCAFSTPGEKALVRGTSPEGVAQVIVGPPQPVTAISCYGTCIPTYGDCFVQGQYVGACCNGFCAGNKCRPWRSS